MQQKHQDPKLNKAGAFYRYTTMAMQMMLTMLVFVFAGFYIDKWLELKFPVFTLVLTLAGVAGALYSVIRNLLK